MATIIYLSLEGKIKHFLDSLTEEEKLEVKRRFSKSITIKKICKRVNCQNEVFSRTLCKEHFQEMFRRIDE